MGIPERPLDSPDGNTAVPGTTAPGTVGILGLGLIGGSFARASPAPAGASSPPT